MADSKGLIIILLTIIGIVLTLYLIINNITIVTFDTPPFVDGTKIRIRSLINNKYMIPSPGPLENANLIFDGIKGQNETEWQLCQDPTLNNRGEYVMYYQTTNDNVFQIAFFKEERSTIFTPVVFNRLSCDDNKKLGSTIPPGSGIESGALLPWMSFFLIEKGNIDPLFGNVASNVYEIRNDNSQHLVYSGVEGSATTAVMADIDTGGNPLETSFVVEVIS